MHDARKANRLDKARSWKVLCLGIMLSHCLASFFSVALAADFRYDSHEKRDPFFSSRDARPMNEQAAKRLDIHLEGIVFDSEGEPVAIVNDEIYHEGDHLAQYVITRIREDGVYFESEDEEFMVPIVVENGKK
jgi:type II secretory pathway component PulC